MPVPGIEVLLDEVDVTNVPGLLPEVNVVTNVPGKVDPFARLGIVEESVAKPLARLGTGEESNAARVTCPLDSLCLLSKGAPVVAHRLQAASEGIGTSVAEELESLGDCVEELESLWDCAEELESLREPHKLSPQQSPPDSQMLASFVFCSERTARAGPVLSEAVLTALDSLCLLPDDWFITAEPLSVRECLLSETMPKVIDNLCGPPDTWLATEALLTVLELKDPQLPWLCLALAKLVR